MISHLVLFTPPASLSDAERRVLLQAVSAGLRACATVRSVRVGRRVLHGLPGYERAMRQDYQYVLMLEFEDVEGLKAYLTHPAHAALGQAFASADASLAYDYEMMTLEEAAAREAGGRS